MNVEAQQSEILLLNRVGKDKLAKVWVELINSDRGLQRAVLEVVVCGLNVATRI